MTKLAFVAGAGIGYVLGTRAGHDQYEKIMQKAKEFEESPAVKQAMSKGQDLWHETKDKLPVETTPGANGAHRADVTYQPTAAN